VAYPGGKFGSIAPRHNGCGALFIQMRCFLVTIELETGKKYLKLNYVFHFVERHGLSPSLYYRIVSTMQFFRNNNAIVSLISYPRESFPLPDLLRLGNH